MSAASHISLGKLGQHYVEKFLHQQGYRLLAQNYQERSGELDLVMTKGDTVCFIEVKTRKNLYLPISMAVNWPKQQKIARTALSFAGKHHLTDKVLRFDVATVLLTGQNQPKIDYIPNAFTAQLY